MAERFQKGHQQSIGDGYKHQMEQRCYSRPPEMTEAPVCTRSEKMRGVPLSGHRLHLLGHGRGLYENQI